MLTEALGRVQRRSSRLSSGRPLTFLVGVSAIGAHLFAGPSYGALGGGVALLAVFAVLVVWHARVAAHEAQLEAAILFCQRGLARVGDGAGLPARGDRAAAAGHPYASDLDLLGEGSVLARLDAMETALSEERLTRWLLEPAGASEVRERQLAVGELGPLATLREDLFVHGRAVATGHPDLGGFVAWCERQGGGETGLLVLAIALPVATAALFFGGAAIGAPSWAWGVTAAAQWVLSLARGGGPTSRWRAGGPRV